MKQKQLANSPWQNPKFDLAEAAAIQALFRGDATADQQKTAIDYVVSEVCALKYWPCDPLNPTNTNIALGKHAVGHFIVMLKNLNLTLLKRDQNA
jgi:hypothetical protein